MQAVALEKDVTLAEDATAATMTDVQPREDNELLPLETVTQVSRLETMHAGLAAISP